MKQVDFLIGKRGLDFTNDFYPEDIPKEWRFDYYANMFHTLLLPIDTNEDIDEMLSDADDRGFSLIMEIKEEDAQDIETLKPLLSLVDKYKKDIILFISLKKDLKAEIYLLLSEFKLALQSPNKLNVSIHLKDFTSKNLLDSYIYFNDVIVVISDKSVNSDSIRGFFDSVAKNKHNALIICDQDDSDVLLKVKEISEMLGH